MTSYKNKRRKYDIEDINELLERNIDLASHIHVDLEKCVHPSVLEWFHNYDHLTSGQPLSLYYSFMTTIAHLSMESTVMQWNKIPRFLNLYSIILGYSGVTKSGSVRECREALEEFYEFLLANNIGNPNSIHSILDKFTEAGFIDQLKESTNVIIIQEEIDLALKQMSFFSNNTPDTGRQMFCQLFDGLTMRKKTKGYKQRIRNARMTICGTSTGVLLPPILQDFLKHVMIDGVVVRCLFLVLSYRPYLRQDHIEPDSKMPTIAQLLMATTILGRRQYIYSEDAQLSLDNYIQEISKQAADANSSRLTSFLAKQASQVTRLSALVQIIDILPLIIQHVNIVRAPDDTLGLNMRLYNQMEITIRQLFKPQITITRESTARAIYFHGYLLEQTLQVFDVSTLQDIPSNMSSLAGPELKEILMRQIIMLPKIIITKENLYSINENKKIDRCIGTQSFETLVFQGLLLKDYFVITSTRRSIECYAKVLPKNNADRDVISNQLRLHHIELNDYIDVSRSVGIQPPVKLSPNGQQLFSNSPYSEIYDIYCSAPVVNNDIYTQHQNNQNNVSIINHSSSLSTNISSSDQSKTPQNNRLVHFHRRFTQSLSQDQMNPIMTSISNNIYKQNNHFKSNISLRCSTNSNYSFTNNDDMADEANIIITND